MTLRERVDDDRTRPDAPKDEEKGGSSGDSDEFGQSTPPEEARILDRIAHFTWYGIPSP